MKEGRHTRCPSQLIAVKPMEMVTMSVQLLQSEQKHREQDTPPTAQTQTCTDSCQQCRYSH